MTIITILLLYFIPSVIAFMRAHSNFASIFVVNLFLGWTFLGWVVCFAWSVSGKQKVAR